MLGHDIESEESGHADHRFKSVTLSFIHKAFSVTYSSTSEEITN